MMLNRHWVFICIVSSILLVGFCQFTERIIVLETLDESIIIGREPRWRIRFTVFRSTDEPEPRAPDNTCLCQNSYINRDGSITGFQLQMGACMTDSNQELCPDPDVDPKWTCNCPFTEFDGECLCRFEDGDRTPVNTLWPINDRGTQAEFVGSEKRVCFNICEEHSISGPGHGPSDLLCQGFFGGNKCVISTWVYCVCEDVRSGMTEPCTCDVDRTLEPFNPPACYIEPQLHKCITSGTSTITASPDASVMVTDSSGTSTKPKPTGGDGDSSAVNIGVPVYAAIGGGGVLVIIIIILLIILCCCCSQNRRSDSSEDVSADKRRKSSGLGTFSKSFVYKREPAPLPRPDIDTSPSTNNYTDVKNPVAETNFDHAHYNKIADDQPEYVELSDDIKKEPAQNEDHGSNPTDQPEYAVLNEELSDYKNDDVNDNNIDDPVYFKLEKVESNQDEKPDKVTTSAGSDNYGYLDINEVKGPTVGVNEYGTLSSGDVTNQNEYDTLSRGRGGSDGTSSEYDTLARGEVGRGPVGSSMIVHGTLPKTEETYQHLDH